MRPDLDHVVRVRVEVLQLVAHVPRVGHLGTEDVSDALPRAANAAAAATGSPTTASAALVRPLRWRWRAAADLRPEAGVGLSDVGRSADVLHREEGNLEEIDLLAVVLRQIPKQLKSKDDMRICKLLDLHTLSDLPRGTRDVDDVPAVVVVVASGVDDGRLWRSPLRHRNLLAGAPFAHPDQVPGREPKVVRCARLQAF